MDSISQASIAASQSGVMPTQTSAPSQSASDSAAFSPSDSVNLSSGAQQALAPQLNLPSTGDAHGDALQLQMQQQLDAGDSEGAQRTYEELQNYLATSLDEQEQDPGKYQTRPPELSNYNTNLPMAKYVPGSPGLAPEGPGPGGTAAGGKLIGGRLQLNPAIAGPKNFSRIPGCKQEQCAEYVSRYFRESGKPLPWAGNAGDWWENSAGKAGYSRLPNGGQARPQPGDIMVFKGGSGGYGHVAIVTAVTDRGVEVQQANWGDNNNGQGAGVKHTFRYDPATNQTYSGISNLPVVGYIRPEGGKGLAS